MNVFPVATKTDWDELVIPGHGITHVWFASLPAGWRAPASFTALLSPTERERAGRLRVDDARTRFVTARAVLRRLLGRYLDLAPERVPLAYSDGGKPHLSTTAGRDLRFSLSHSGRFLLVAAALGRAVGADVEVPRTCRWQPVAHRLFDASTRQLLARLPQDDALRAFFHAWTQREAFVKAIGGRVLRVADPFPLRWPPVGEPVTDGSEDQPARWSLWTRACPPAVVSVVTECAEPTVEARALPGVVLAP